MKGKFIVVCLSAIIMVLGLSTLTASAEENDKRMTILFTNDLHDHFMPFEINQKGTVYQAGGYARLQRKVGKNCRKLWLLTFHSQLIRRAN